MYSDVSRDGVEEWLLWYCYEVNQANYRFDFETFWILVRIIPYHLGLELEAML
jgi:hypothetical protein